MSSDYFYFVLLLPSVKMLMISIRSEACNDRGKRRHCGLTNIKVNGKDYSKHSRGYNIVVLRADTGNTVSCNFTHSHLGIGAN